MNTLIQNRRRLYVLLAELSAAGLIDYTTGPEARPGDGPHLDIFARRGRIEFPAPPSLSPAARELWDLLRTGTAQAMVDGLEAN